MDVNTPSKSSDPFNLLGMDRRPWLPVESIQTAYRERAKHLHPDAPAGCASQFAALTAAKDAILNPTSRLKHLACGSAPPGDSQSHATFPPIAAELGFEIGNAIQLAEQHLREAEKHSGLNRLLAVQKIKSSEVTIIGLKTKLAQLMHELESETKALDERWPAQVTESDLTALSDRWQYAQRWQQQIRAAHFEIQNSLSKHLPKAQ